MSKISKITSITHLGDWTPNGANEPLQQFLIKYEDHTELKVNAKTNPPPYAVGDLMEYVVKGTNSHGDWGSTSKPKMADATTPPSAKNATVQTQFKADPLKQASIELQVCLKEANLFHQAHGFDNLSGTAERIKELADTAKMLYKELFSNG